MSLRPWETLLPALAGLLVVAGAAKVWRPADLSRALRAAGAPVGTGAVRAGAALETLIGCWALAAGGRLGMVGVGASYVGFAGFVVLALLRGTPLATCGCFGEPDTPPTVAHAAVCAVGGALAVAAALFAPPPGVGEVLSDLGPGRAVGLVVLTVTAGAAVYLVISAAPRLAIARRQLKDART